MTRRGGRSSFAFAGLVRCALVASLSISGTAHAADTKERDECVAAAESGQVLRDQNKFVDANDAFSGWARGNWPAVVKQDCARWLIELQEKTPSVVLRAQDDDGKDVPDVAVTMDGAPFTAKLDGTLAQVNPGEHAFRFEAQGYVAVEQRAVFLAGDRSRSISAVLKRSPAAAPGATASASSTHPGDGKARSSSALGTAAWIGAGVAVAALATGAVLGLTALTQRDSDFAPGGCAPRCSTDEADGIHTRLVIADVVGGVGLAAAAFAVFAFVASHERPAHGPVQLSAGGLRIAF